MAGLTTVQGVTRQVDYWWVVLLRTWRGNVVTAFVAPLFYVLAMGVLLGGFIAGDPDRLEGATSYLSFIVPGLVAGHAMQLAVGETTYPVFGAIKWDKTYQAQLATPLGVRDLVNGHLGFMLFRVATACAVFLLVLVPFGVYATWWGVVGAWLVQVLVAACFGSLVYALTVRLQSEEGFGVIFRLGVVPLTLFSGAFFPISNLGPVLSWVARCTPLWHGVDLTRRLCLDTVEAPLALLHVAVLLVLTALGWRWSMTGLAKRMAS